MTQASASRWPIAAARLVVAAVLAAIAVLQHVPTASAEAVEVRITWHGVYRTTTDALVRDDTGFTGQRIVSTGVMPPAVSSDRIPAIAGTRFGFGFEIIGALPGTRFALTWVRRYPPGGIRDAATGHRVEVERAPVTAIGGDKGAVVGYRFDHPEEMVPGPWTFELWQGELKVAEKRFEILPP